MKFLFTCLIFFLITHLSQAQTQIIRAYHPESNKTITFKENDRIRIKTIFKRKYNGRIHFINSDTIQLRTNKIAVKDITKIKFHPLGPSLTFGILSYTFAGYFSVIGIFAPLILKDITYIAFLAPVPILTYFGINTPNFNKGYAIKKGWKIESTIQNNNLISN